jgi:hypothetical protein
MVLEMEEPSTDGGWRSQDSVDTLSAWLVSRFELLRADAAQMAMTARAIGERIDVVTDVVRR